MGWSGEALILLLAAALAWRTWRAGAGPAAHAATGIALGLLGGGLAAWMAAALASTVSANPMVRLALPLVVAGIAFAAVRWGWWRDAQRRARWSAALRHRPRAARAILGLTIAVRIASLVLVAGVVANLIASRWPSAEEVIREHTLVMQHLLAPRSPRAAPASGASLSAVRQRQLVGGLGRLAASGRAALVDVSGLGAALEAIDVIREIGDLGYGPTLWLMRNQPSLARLVDHPGLRAVASDPAVLSEIARVGHGSLAAAWRLGDRADIQALFADPELHAALAAVRLSQLRDGWRARRSEGEPVPVTWLMRVREAAEWSEQPEGLENLDCAERGQRLELRASLPAGAAAGYRLAIIGLDAPRLMVDGQPCALTATATSWSATIVVAEDGTLAVSGVSPPTGRFRVALSQAPEAAR